VAFTFSMQSGATVTMTGTLAEGKLTGTFDMGGSSSGVDGDEEEIVDSR